MPYTPGHIEGEHVVLTGPIVGTVTLADGEVVNVSDPVVAARDEAHAAEIAHAIGQHWSEPQNIHPQQVNVDDDGNVTVNDFVYDDTHHKQAMKAAKKKG